MVPVVDLTAYKNIICGQRNTGDTKKITGGENTIYHPRNKKRLPYKGKAKTVARKQNPGDVNASEKVGNLRLPGDQTTRPREGTVRRLPLAELDGGARSFAGDTEGCCVGRACRGCAAARGPVALGRAGAPLGILKRT